MGAGNARRYSKDSTSSHGCVTRGVSGSDDWGSGVYVGGDQCAFCYPTINLSIYEEGYQVTRPEERITMEQLHGTNPDDPCPTGCFNVSKGD